MNVSSLGRLHALDELTLLQQTPARANQKGEDAHTKRLRATQSETRTPRFLIGPAASQSPGLQFASTPRFLFGGGNGPQSQAQAFVEEIERGEKDHYPNLKRPSRRHVLPVALKEEVIPDSETESIENVGSVSSDDEDGQVVFDSFNETDIHEEGEELLPASPKFPSSKRQRRLFRPSSPPGGFHHETAGSPRGDRISSSPFSPPPATALGILSPSSKLAEDEFVTPPRRKLFASSRRDSQPSSSARYPRFSVNSRQAEATLGDQNHLNDPDHAATGDFDSTQPVKPRFVLPTTPTTVRNERGSGIMTSPTPYSPLAHRTKRDLASSVVKPNFISKGMAAEVRSWILELEAKRQGNPHTPNPISLRPSSTTCTTQDELDVTSSKIESQDGPYLTAQVASLKSSLLSSPGAIQQPYYENYRPLPGRPAPFVLATLSRQERHVNQLTADRALLFNPPLRTIPGKIVMDGDTIRVKKGLLWNIGIGIDVSVGEDSGAIEGPATSYVVGVKWDILN